MYPLTSDLIASGRSFSLISEAVSETALRSSLTVLVSPSRVCSVSRLISSTDRLPSEIMLSPPNLLVGPIRQLQRCSLDARNTYRVHRFQAGTEFDWSASSTQGAAGDRPHRRGGRSLSSRRNLKAPFERASSRLRPSSYLLE